MAIAANHNTVSVAKIFAILGLGILAFIFVLVTFLGSGTQNYMPLEGRVDGAMTVIGVMETSPDSLEINRVEPLSPQVMSAPPVAPESTMDPSFQAEYTIFWENFRVRTMKMADLNQDGMVTPDEMEAFTIKFFMRLGYSRDATTGFVFTTNGVPVSPSTLTCHLNGYIPDKEYIKPNCPAE